MRALRAPNHGILITTALATMLLSLAAGPAAALEPKKASEIIMVRCFNSSYECPLYPTQGQILKRDGTMTPFVLPTNKAMVVTSVEVTAFGGTPGAAVSVFFYLAPVTGPVPEVMRVDGTFNSAGEFTGTKEMNTGVVFNAVASPVFYANSTTVTSIVGRLTGYLVADR